MKFGGKNSIIFLRSRIDFRNMRSHTVRMVRNISEI